MLPEHPGVSYICTRTSEARAQEPESISKSASMFFEKSRRVRIVGPDGSVNFAGFPLGEAVQVDLAESHEAETAPLPAPPLDLDDNEHAIRRISTPLITMGGPGGLSRKCSRSAWMSWCEEVNLP